MPHPSTLRPSRSTGPATSTAGRGGSRVTVGGRWNEGDVSDIGARPRRGDRMRAGEFGGSREVRDRDGAAALPRVPRRRRPLLPRGRDRARFYLANSVDVKVRADGGEVYFDVTMQRRLGLGHLPSGALRQERARRDLQGRQRRGAGQVRPRAAQERRLPVRRCRPQRAAAVPPSTGGSDSRRESCGRVGA